MMFEQSPIAVRRKEYLALAKRRGRPGTGSRPFVEQKRSFVQTAPDLQAIFKKTAYLVVEGFATRLYMRERMTFDTDVLVLVQDEKTCELELIEAGCRKLASLSIGGTTWELPDGTELDVIVSDEPWAQVAVREPVYDEAGLPTIRLPYLALMKLFAGRVQDIADITRMLGGADEGSLLQVRAAVAEYAPDAVEDVESMIRLGRMEYE